MTKDGLENLMCTLSPETSLSEGDLKYDWKDSHNFGSLGLSSPEVFVVFLS